MPDNAQPRYDATPKQDGNLIDRDLGEAVYARHARFVWPTSIASSLARRYAPFTDQRLPLAMVVQRRWSVVNSSVARMPDVHWLQAFTPGSPRNAVFERRQYATGTMATSLAASVSSPLAPELARSMAPKISPSPAHEGAPPASAREEAARSFLSGAAQDESAMAQRSTEASGQVTGHSLPETSNRTDFVSRAAELTLRTAPEARSAAGEIAPTAKLPQELGAASASRVAQDGSTETHRFSEVSRQIERGAAPVAPTVHTDASVSGSALGRPATVYNAPPIIRRSVASRQRGIAHTDSSGQQISESSNATREITAQRSSEVAPVEPPISAEPSSGSSKTDRVILDSPGSHKYSLPSYSPAGRPIAREAQVAEVHHINQSTSASRIQDTVARQPLQLSLHEATLQNQTPTAAPSQIVSPDRATIHDPLIMTHATARSHEASTEPASPQGSIAARSLQGASGSGQAVSDTPAPSQTPSQPLPQGAHDVNSVPHVAENAPHGRIVVPESHTDAPATAMLHLNESSSHAPAVTSADRTGESYGSALPSPVLRANGDSAADRSPVRLKSDSVSPDTSSAGSLDTARANVSDESSLQLNNAARSHTNDSAAALAHGPNVQAVPRIFAAAHSSERNLSRSDVEAFGTFKKSEPTFRSASSILRSAGTRFALGSSSRPGISRDTMIPVVVQESAVAGTSQAEPLVLSRQAISRDASHDLASSPAASIATQSIGLMHRNPSTMARFASSYGSGTMHLASLPVARQATADTAPSSMQLPSLPSVTAGAANAPSFGGASPDITQLANRVYDVLVRRLASERQRRGR